MNKSRIFEVYQQGKKIFTKNLTPGIRFFDEEIVKDDKEYREWNPKRSKLASMILKGCQDIKIRKGDVVLYLGAASGQTASYVSDIVGENGFVFAVDFAPRVVRDLVFLCEIRKNIAPLLADANKPLSYMDKISAVDIIYQDVAQKNQTEIFLKNVEMFLKPGGFGLLAVKSRSIDVAMKPKQIFYEVRQALEKSVIIVDYKTLDPFEMDHAMFIVKKK